MKKQNLLIGGIVTALLLVVIVRLVLVLSTPATPVDQTVATSTSTVQQQIGGMLNADSGIMTYAGEVDVTYIDQNQIVDVQMGTIHTDSEDIKWTAYYAMKDIWTSGISPIKGVSITMRSDQTNQDVGHVFQSHTLDWDNLSQDSAWNAYDTATLF
jgi:hypothetical protein